MSGFSSEVAKNSRVYLDHHAHTPMTSGARLALFRASEELDHNPHGTGYDAQRARESVEEARAHVARLVDCKPSDLVFTSGATEANNIALRGVLDHLARTKNPKVALAEIEHPSAIMAVPSDRRVALRCCTDGSIDPDEVARSIDDGAGLVSVAAANHEIGTQQPIDEIAKVAHERGVMFHTDATQAVAYDEQRAFVGVQLISFSSHKIGGPMGIGALVVRRSARRIIEPLFGGGSQERGLRAGTIPVPLCVSFGVAAKEACARKETEIQRLRQMRDRLRNSLCKVGSVVVNGSTDNRLPNNLNVRFQGVDGEALVHRLRNNVTLSTGSACTADSLEPSKVLTAIGVRDEDAAGAIRIGLGHTTTDEEVERAAIAITEAVVELRQIGRRVA